MQIVIGSTVYHTYYRMEGFLKSLADCIGIENYPIVMLNTGPEKSAYIEIPLHLDLVEKSCPNRRRVSTSIMWEKIEAAKEFCDDDTIYVSVDDDYAFNPYVFEFCKTIFEENPQVNYMSPMLYPGVDPTTRESVPLSGFKLALTDSCLGGALVARWSHYYPAMLAYFEEYGIDGNNPGKGRTIYDQEFFAFLGRWTGQPLNMYTTFLFSLMQHCNMISTAIEQRGSLLNHMYGGKFDPRLNPFHFRNLI